MGIVVAIEAYEGDAPAESLLLSPLLGHVLASPALLARLPKSDAGRFLSPTASGSRARPKARSLASASVALEALALLASILEEERSLDVLTCEDATTGEEIVRARFDVGPRYVHAAHYHLRERAEPPLRSIPGVPAEGPVPELVLPGITNRMKRIDGVEQEVREELPVRLRWRTAFACHPADWAALRAFVVAHPNAGLRLVTT